MRRENNKKNKQKIKFGIYIAALITAAGVFGGCKAIEEHAGGKDIRVITYDAVPTTMEMMEKGIICTI